VTATGVPAAAGPVPVLRVPEPAAGHHDRIEAVVGDVDRPAVAVGRVGEEHVAGDRDRAVAGQLDRPAIAVVDPVLELRVAVGEREVADDHLADVGTGQEADLALALDRGAGVGLLALKCVRAVRGVARAQHEGLAGAVLRERDGVARRRLVERGLKSLAVGVHARQRIMRTATTS
jgi:hypothetical protein